MYLCTKINSAQTYSNAYCKYLTLGTIAISNKRHSRLLNGMAILNRGRRFSGCLMSGFVIQHSSRLSAVRQYWNRRSSASTGRGYGKPDIIFCFQFLCCVSVIQSCDSDYVSIMRRNLSHLSHAEKMKRWKEDEMTKRRWKDEKKMKRWKFHVGIVRKRWNDEKKMKW